MNATDFHLDQLRPLVGATILAVARTGHGESEWDEEYFGLVLRLPNGQRKTLLFLADPEGNGPGSFELIDG